MRPAPSLLALAFVPLLLAPGPLAAQAPAAPQSVKELPPYEVVSDPKTGTWYGRFGRTNCAWVDMGDSVLLLDTGGSEADARNLASQVKQTTGGKPVRWIVLTHLHADSNAGIKTFLGSDPTVIVNARIAPIVGSSLTQDAKTKGIAVLGVSDRVALGTGSRVVEVAALPGPAHTDHDLFAHVVGTGIVFVGDLVTPQRCPMLSDPSFDPAGWLKALARLEALQPALLVPTRGNATAIPQNEIAATRTYIERVKSVVEEARKKGWAEARVSSELILKKVGEYCPQQLDSINALALYRRMGPDGKLKPAAPASPAPKK